MIYLLLEILAGFSIPLLPLLTGFFPSLGLGPLKAGHRRGVRLAQVLVVLALAGLSLWAEPTGWGWVGAALAIWFAVVAAHFYPERIFVAVDRPQHAETGLAEGAPVLAVEAGGQAVAYPLETLVPHHIVNDVLEEIPVLASW